MSVGMRVTSTPVLIGLLVGAALLTTVWTATSLQPTSPHLLGFRPAALDSSRWARTADAAVAAHTDVRYERVPERFLLRQLVRSFLAAPWLMPDAGKSRTPRPTPPHGWAFPSAADAPEEGEEVAEEEDEGVMLSNSASVLTAQRLQRLMPRASSSDELPWQESAQPDPWGNADGADASDASTWGGGSDDGGAWDWSETVGGSSEALV